LLLFLLIICGAVDWLLPVCEYCIRSFYDKFVKLIEDAIQEILFVYPPLRDEVKLRFVGPGSLLESQRERLRAEVDDFIQIQKEQFSFDFLNRRTQVVHQASPKTMNLDHVIWLQQLKQDVKSYYLSIQHVVTKSVPKMILYWLVTTSKMITNLQKPSLLPYLKGDEEVQKKRNLLKTRLSAVQDALASIPEVARFITYKN
jgi:hypothetical protein